MMFRKAFMYTTNESVVGNYLDFGVGRAGALSTHGVSARNPRHEATKRVAGTSDSTRLKGFRGRPDHSEQRAVKEWLAEDPQIHLTPYSSYANVGQPSIVSIMGDELEPLATSR